MAVFLGSKAGVGGIANQSFDGNLKKKS